MAPKRSVQKTYGNEIDGTEMVAPKRRDSVTNAVIFGELFLFHHSFCILFVQTFLARDKIFKLVGTSERLHEENQSLKIISKIKIQISSSRERTF